MLCIWQIQSDFTDLASIHTLLENFENTAIFLPSTLTAVTKRSSNRRNLRNPLFCFRVNWTEHILKTELFENHGVMTIMWPPRLSVPYTKIQNNHWLLLFKNSLGISCIFRVKLPQCCVQWALMYRSFLTPLEWSTTKKVTLLSLFPNVQELHVAKSCLQVESLTLFSR